MVLKIKRNQIGEASKVFKTMIQQSKIRTQYICLPFLFITLHLHRYEFFKRILKLVFCQVIASKVNTPS